MLAYIETAILETGFYDDFSKCAASSELNGLSTRDGLHGTPQLNDYQCTYLMLPFICAYMDKAIRGIEDTELTKVDTMYSELLFEL